MITTIHDNNECIVTLNDRKQIDEYTTVVDLLKLKDVLKGLELLGKEVCSIKLVTYVTFDIDTKYYHRFENDFLDKLYSAMNRMPEEQTLLFKNNRLYVLYDGKEIICPIDMCDLGSWEVPELTLRIKYSSREV